jgi:hypothetical protein
MCSLTTSAIVGFFRGVSARESFSRALASSASRAAKSV